MLSLIKKSLIWIVSGTTSLVITACYGMPADYPCLVELKTINTDNEPIPGLSVGMSEGAGEAYTGDDGRAFLESSCGNAIMIYVNDVDGPVNGVYADVAVSLSDLNKDDGSAYIIVMQPGEMPDDDSPGLPDVN